MFGEFVSCECALKLAPPYTGANADQLEKLSSLDVWLGVTFDVTKTSFIMGTRPSIARSMTSVRDVAL